MYNLSENFNREKTIFGVIHLLIFGLSIGLVAWIAKISPSLTSFIESDVLDAGETLLGIKYGYQNLEIVAFVFFAIIIIISFVGVILNFVSKENGSKINIKNTTIAMGVILTIFSIPLIIIGGLALDDNKKLNDFDEVLPGDLKDAYDALKKYVPYDELGISNLVGGCLILIAALFMIFWYFYKMRNKNIEPKEEELPELEPVALRPQNRNL